MTTPAELSDRDLAAVLAEAGNACDLADRGAGFFLSAARRRSASAELLAARRSRRRLAEEWVRRAVERTTGRPGSRIDVLWSPLADPPAVVLGVVDEDGVEPAARSAGGPAAEAELRAALRYLSRDWRGDPQTLTLTRVRPPVGTVADAAADAGVAAREVPPRQEIAAPKRCPMP